MKPGDISKEIFGLAVRLLGLYFLWVGLNDFNVPALMNMQVLKGDQIGDILTTILPAIFNLAVAWWLISGKLVIKRAYSEAPKITERFNVTAERSVPMSKSAQSHEPTNMELADKKLEAFLTK